MKMRRNKRQYGSQHTSETKETISAAQSSRRSVQILATLYVHTLALLMLVVFSRNVFSATIRSVLLPLFR
jgi:hypothetical protein